MPEAIPLTVAIVGTKMLFKGVESSPVAPVGSVTKMTLDAYYAVTQNPRILTMN